jgi:hypothetical protein
MLFYAIVGGALAMCLVVLAVLAIRKAVQRREADNLIRMMEAEDWMGWDEDTVNEAIEHNERVDKR